MAVDVEPKAGEWVRFYRNGAMVIGVVQYVRLAASWSNSEWQAETDQGVIHSLDILERRAAQPPLQGPGNLVAPTPTQEA